MDEESDVDKDVDCSSLLDLHHGLDSSVEECSSVLDKEEFMALKGAQKMENQMDGLSLDPIYMLQEMVQEMKRGFQTAVEELGKIQAKEENDVGKGQHFQKQQQQLDSLTETLHEIKNHLNVLSKDVDLIKDEQKIIKEQLEEVRSNRGSSQDRRSQSDSEIQQVIPLPDTELSPEDWNYKICDLPPVEERKNHLDIFNDTSINHDSEVTSIACKSLSLTQALAEKCLKLNHLESSDEDERSAQRRVSHYAPKTSQLVLQEADNRRHSMPAAPTPENTSKDMVYAVKRQKTVKELADSERDYCSKLWSLLNTYLPPLQSGGFFSSRELEVLIPQYVEQLYLEHCNICTGLQDRLVHWTHMGTVADLFTRVTDSYSIESILPLYQEYAEDLPTAITCLNRALFQSPEFKDFLKAIKHSSCESEDLMALLIAPVQHMPRFLLQLQQILRHTPATHLDYPLLQTSLKRLRSFVDQLNKEVSRAMQLLSQENNLRSNESQGSQVNAVDSIAHFSTCEDDNITSARAFSKSTQNYVHSEWLDDTYSHRSLQQFEDNIRHHIAHPLSSHSNTLSQPDLTSINALPQEVSGLAHFPRSQSSLPASAMADGLVERQYRHYKIKKLHKNPGRAHSQEYILASQSPRARPASAIDFISRGPHQYQYNHFNQRLYPGPLPRPHSALGPPLMDGQHRPVIISRKHLRRSQPLVGTKSVWPETSSANITSPLIYPRMKDDDDDDDTRTSDTHSLGTSGSHHHSDSHCSNEGPDLELENLAGSIHRVLSSVKKHDLNKPLQFSAAEVTANLAKKLYNSQQQHVGSELEKSKVTTSSKSDVKMSTNLKEVNLTLQSSGNPFKSSTFSSQPTISNDGKSTVYSEVYPDNTINSSVSKSPNPFIESETDSHFEHENGTKLQTPECVKISEDNDTLYREVLPSAAQREVQKLNQDKQLLERNKQFLLSLASLNSVDGQNRHSFRDGTVGDSYRHADSETSQQDSHIKSSNLPPQPPPRTSKLSNVGVESRFSNVYVESEYVGLINSSSMKAENFDTPAGPSQVFVSNSKGLESRQTITSVKATKISSQGYQRNNSQGPSTVGSTHGTNQPYTSTLDPFTQSGVTFFSAEIQPTVKTTNPFLTSSRNNAANMDSISTVSDKNENKNPVKEQPRDSNINLNGSLPVLTGSLDPADDSRKKEDRLRSKDGGRLSQTYEISRASDDPMTARKKMHFKASIKNLFSKKKGKIILADVEREVVMEMACNALSATGCSDLSCSVSQKKDSLKSNESDDPNRGKEDVIFEIKTRKDQGSSTASPVKVSKIFHHQPKVEKLADEKGKNCSTLSKNEISQLQTSLCSTRSQGSLPVSITISRTNVPTVQPMNDEALKKDNHGLIKRNDSKTSAQTTKSATQKIKNKTIHQDGAGQDSCQNIFSKIKNNHPQKQIKPFSGKNPNIIKGSKSQADISESGTLLVRKFDIDQQVVAGEVNSCTGIKETCKSFVLCHKCQTCGTDQNKNFANDSSMDGNLSNVCSKNSAIEKCQVCGSCKQNKSQNNNNVKNYGGIDSNMVTIVSDDANCTECLKPCSSATKGFKQNSQSVCCQELHHQNKLNPSSAGKCSTPTGSTQVIDTTVDVTNKVTIQEDKISGHNPNKISENKITKSFLKLFPHSLPPKYEGGTEKENLTRAGADRKSSKPSKKSLLPVTVLTSNLASTAEVSSNADKGISNLKKFQAKSIKMVDELSHQKHQSVNKLDDKEIDTSKHYVLKGKEFDHHYRLYYDEETGVGSPNQSPQQECKNKDYLTKKETHRHDIQTKSYNDAPKMSNKDAKLRNIHLPYCYSTHTVQSQPSGSDIFSEISENSKPRSVWALQKQKTFIKMNDVLCDKEKSTSRQCVTARQSHLKLTSETCSPPEDSSSKPSVPSSIVQEDIVSTSNRNMYKLIPDNITCAIDGQKHSTGIPVMPIILPVVGSQDQQTSPQFNFWPSYLSMPLTNSNSYDHCNSEQYASVVELPEDTKSEETAVKQDANSPQPESAACDESNSYKPRKSQQTSSSAADVAVHSDNIHNNSESKQITEMTVIHSSNNLSKVLVRNADCLADSGTFSNMMVTKNSSAPIVCPEIVLISKNEQDNMMNFREEIGTSAYPEIFRQNNIPFENSRKLTTNTSSQCGLLSRHTLNLVASSNHNSEKSLLNVDGFETEDPITNFDFNVKVKPERRSKNKVLVNIGNNPSATTVIDNSNVSQNFQAHYDKHGQKYNQDSVVMRKYGHKSRHIRATNADTLRGFTHNITPQPYQMNRPISHPHGGECLILGNVGKNGTRYWSLHTDLTRTSPNHFTGQTSRNDLSVRNSNYGDSKRTSPISQSSYSPACDEIQRNQFTTSPNIGDDQMAQVIVQCTPDLLPLDKRQRNEPVVTNKEKTVKPSQSLFSRLTQSSLSFFSRDPKPSNAPK